MKFKDIKNFVKLYVIAIVIIAVKLDIKNIYNILEYIISTKPHIKRIACLKKFLVFGKIF